MNVYDYELNVMIPTTADDGIRGYFSRRCFSFLKKRTRLVLGTLFVAVWFNATTKQLAFTQPVDAASEGMLAVTLLILVMPILLCLRLNVLKQISNQSEKNCGLQNGIEKKM